MKGKNKFAVAKVFSDHCVLQREKPICVFGTASDEEEVRAALFSNGKKCISENLAVAKEGRWQLYLPPVKAQENASLTVSTKNESIIFKDISVGEVWLAGGQSNMEFELGNCTEGTAEFEKEIRLAMSHSKSALDLVQVPMPGVLKAPGASSLNRFGMAIDLDACDGCGKCILACIEENNIPLSPKEQRSAGRFMHWIELLIRILQL